FGVTFKTSNEIRATAGALNTSSSRISLNDLSAKEIDSKTDLQQEESINSPAEHRSYTSSHSSTNSLHVPPQNSENTHDELWPLGRPEVSQIKSLNVKCEKNHMKVNIEFDRPFYGMIFSKGHYSDPKCIHLPSGTGHLVANFDIFLGACGMASSDQIGYESAAAVTGLYIENTIIVQYDPQVQEIWDQARRLRCTWYDFYEKAVSFRSFNVDMQDAVTANFLGDNIQCWMQIQVGKGPWAREVAGIVKIGQIMTMVLAIKDDENKFDMLVRNCVAHDGKRAPIELVDSVGCIVRHKVMSKFTKIVNFGSSATVLSYAHFQAFKFPDSMEVHFQCTIQVCRHKCPEQCSQSTTGQVENANHDAYSVSSNFNSVGKPREARDLSKHVKNMINTVYTLDTKEIGLNRIINVVASGDLAFSVNSNDTLPSFDFQEKIETDLICMSTISFTASVVVLISILTISCLVSVFLCLRQRMTAKSQCNNLRLIVF
ncbi:uncharacterized protein B4U80_05301, partial [Leptotrombidium deliense]